MSMTNIPEPITGERSMSTAQTCAAQDTHREPGVLCARETVHYGHAKPCSHEYSGIQPRAHTQSSLSVGRASCIHALDRRPWPKARITDISQTQWPHSGGQPSNCPAVADRTSDGHYSGGRREAQKDSESASNMHWRL
jgi:hypothetical protein